MNETFKFLKENTQVNYLDTVKGDKPSCRPFGDPIMYDGKIYVITSKHKEVSKQIAENNNVCIVAYDDENWIRINCQLIDDSNNVAVKQAVINEFDWAIEAGYTLDNPDFQILYMANVDSTIYDEEGNVTKSSDYALANPKIVSYTPKQSYLKTGEACLSVPEDVKGYVPRHAKITVEGFDVLTNKDVKIVARGFLAICLQHELDHFDGVLYYDHINKEYPLVPIENAMVIE